MRARRALAYKMPSYILLYPVIVKPEVNMCEKIVYGMLYVFKPKNRKIVQFFFVGKSGPLIIKLDHVI